MVQLYFVALSSLVRKEVTRFMRIWIQTLLPPVITTTLYFVIFGNFIGGQVSNIDGFTFIQVMVPGLIMQSIITNSYSNVSSSFFIQKFHRSIEELLVSPMPTLVMMSGFLAGGMLRGLLAGTLVTLVSLFFVPFYINALGIVLLIGIFTSLLFSLAGLLNALLAKSFDDISIVPTFILTPLTYLGGVFIPISALSPFWQNISRINPIVYMISGFRYGFLGMVDVPLSLSISVLLIFTATLFGVCFHLIEKGRGLRT